MATAKLISITNNYMDLIKTACSKPYGNKVGDKGVGRIIESGHLSVIEHAYASFDVTCSVRVLGQITRHRHFSFTVASARGKVFDKFVERPAIREIFGDEADKFIEMAMTPYREAIARGMKEEDAAYFLPQGIETTFVITGNFRAWCDYLPKRLCKRAMPEHRELATEIYKQLKAFAPETFDRNFMNCADCTERGCEFK